MLAIAQDTAPQYPLGHSEREMRRLVLQAAFYEPFTHQVFADAGLAPGMRVLDLGSGVGDVSLLAARFVGSGGEVVGLELDHDKVNLARRRAREHGLQNVRFLHGSVDDLSSCRGGERFDALIGRWILIFLPDPVLTLRAWLRRVRPGGIVAFLDSTRLDEMARAHPPLPLATQVSSWIRQAAEHAGLDLHFGLALHHIFRQAGLPPPHMAEYTPVGGGPDWPGYELHAEQLRSFLPILTASGIATHKQVAVDTLAERLRAAATERGAVLTTETLVAAWTRKRTQRLRTRKAVAIDAKAEPVGSPSARSAA